MFENSQKQLRNGSMTSELQGAKRLGGKKSAVGDKNRVIL